MALTGKKNCAAVTPGPISASGLVIISRFRKDSWVDKTTLAAV